ncbi:MAG: ATP-dependent zinc metalloprotease FtsH [Coriobacteriales bacterium]|nr:ATP-dependent zinc metalloprotease FtsH [Coriobacteriales bacterium]
MSDKNLDKTPKKDNKNRKEQNEKARRTAIIALIACVLIVAVFALFFRQPNSGEIVELKTSEFVSAVNADRVTEVTYHASSATLDGRYYKDEDAFKANETTPFTSTYTGDDSLQALMAEHPNIAYHEDVSTNTWLVSLLTTLLPLILIALFIWFIFSRASNMSNSQMNFGKTKAKKQSEEIPDVTFDDVAGIDEAVEELREIKDFLSNPQKYQKMGAKIPRGCLLVGPPGCGKTLLAKAVAGEAEVPYFNISGSDFVEMFVGVGASRVRDLFKQAKEAAPSIIFIDEIDAVGRQRGAGLGGGHDEREQTLNQLLVEMDGFDDKESVIMLAATNRADILDPALLRPGRFDRQIIVDRPDLGGRERILEVHAKGKPIDPKVDLKDYASLTVGFSGADLANLLNEAALLAARRGKDIIEADELNESIERVIAGPQHKGRKITDEEKRCTAYHESGHALVGHLLEHTDPIHKITIIPRGRAGGYTLSRPTEDRMLETRNEMLDEIAMFLGGRVAEEIAMGDVTTGASNDLERATKLAKNIVKTFGMSDKLGYRVYGEQNHEVFLGRDYNSTPDYGEETANLIDEEISRIVTEAHDRAYKLLTENRTLLDTMANVLFERETLDGDALKYLLDDKWDEYLVKEKADAQLAAQQKQIEEQQKQLEEQQKKLDQQQKEIDNLSSGQADDAQNSSDAEADDDDEYYVMDDQDSSKTDSSLSKKHSLLDYVKANKSSDVAQTNEPKNTTPDEIIPTRETIYDDSNDDIPEAEYEQDDSE